MSLENWLLGEPAADVRATMREEDCEKCFGCPHATVMASVISSMANTTHDFTTRVADIGSDLLNDSTNEVAKAIKNQEDLQEDYRAQLHAITQPCIGWLDGAGSSIAPRPAEMCNSPESGDPKISIAAAWLLERLAKIGIKTS